MDQLLNMSAKELSRSEVIQKLSEKRMSQKEAGTILHLSTRQIKRLLKAYRKKGGVTPFQWIHGGLRVVGYEHAGLRTDWVRDSRSQSDDDVDCTSLR